MKIAVPLFGRDVAPRFGFVDQFLIATIAKKHVGQSITIAVGENAGWHERLEQLKQHGVEMLLCGGFNRRFEPLATSFGIKVIAGLTGDALTLAETYARGEHLNPLCGCRSNNSSDRRPQNGRGRKIRCRDSNTN